MPSCYRVSLSTFPHSINHRTQLKNIGVAAQTSGPTGYRNELTISRFRHVLHTLVTELRRKGSGVPQYGRITLLLGTSDEVGINSSHTRFLPPV